MLPSEWQPISLGLHMLKKSMNHMYISNDSDFMWHLSGNSTKVLSLSGVTTMIKWKYMVHVVHYHFFHGTQSLQQNNKDKFLMVYHIILWDFNPKSKMMSCNVLNALASLTKASTLEYHREITCENVAFIMAANFFGSSHVKKSLNHMYISYDSD